MKLAAILLVILGIGAALCAAFLVSAMRLPSVEVRSAAPRAEDVQEVQVLFANRLIPAMTVVDARSVTARMVPKNKAPKDYISNAVDVVGKIAQVPIVESQSFTMSCFADASPSRQVAEAIPHGKRAVGIAITDFASLEGMLYPGSTVDVMASFPTKEGEQRDTLTNTLLENIQVLAIEQQTIVSGKPGLVGDTASPSRGNTRRVTLLVDINQAKALRAAMENGTLSLALRNPMDAGRSSKGGVSARELMHGRTSLDRAADTMGRYLVEAMKANANRPPPPMPVAQQDPFAAVAQHPTTKPVEEPQWQVEIIRGQAVETRSFPLPKEKSPEVAGKIEK